MNLAGEPPISLSVSALLVRHAETEVAGVVPKNVAIEAKLVLLGD